MRALTVWLPPVKAVFLVLGGKRDGDRISVFPSMDRAIQDLP